MRTLTALLLLATVTLAQDKPAFLGVGVEPLDARLKNMFKVPADVQGVMITALVTPSAASRAGLRLGDVLVKLDGKPLRDRQQLVDAIRAHQPGDRVEYEVRRGTGTISGRLKLGVEEEGTHMAHLRTDPEPPAPPRAEAPRPAPRPEPAPDREPELDERLDKVQREIAELKARALARRKEAAAARPDARPRNLGGWIHREELRLERARKQGAERRVAYHEARLSILRELQQAGVRLPAARLDRVEKKLDEVLAALRAMRK
jgi:hypothetical protein